MYANVPTATSRFQTLSSFSDPFSIAPPVLKTKVWRGKSAGCAVGARRCFAIACRLSAQFNIVRAASGVCGCLSSGVLLGLSSALDRASEVTITSMSIEGRLHLPPVVNRTSLRLSPCSSSPASLQANSSVEIKTLATPSCPNILPTSSAQHLMNICGIETNAGTGGTTTSCG